MNNIKSIRMKQGLSQVELARRMRVRQPRIAELELKAANPKLNTLKKLAKALNVSIEELVR